MPDRDLSLAWAVLEQMGVTRDDRFGPVLLGRELLIRAHETIDREYGVQNATVIGCAAAATFLWGVVDPSPSEYPAGDIAHARADALMWFGISTALFVPANAQLDSDDFPPRPSFMAELPDPLALDTASAMFEAQCDYVKAGRCSEELAEVLKSDGVPGSAKAHFERASDLFHRAGNQERAQIATRRATASDVPSSPFFLRKMGSTESTTLAGSREFHHLRARLKVAKS